MASGVGLVGDVTVTYRDGKQERILGVRYFTAPYETADLTQQPSNLFVMSSQNGAVIYLNPAAVAGVMIETRPEV